MIVDLHDAILLLRKQSVTGKGGGPKNKVALAQPLLVVTGIQILSVSPDFFLKRFDNILKR